ncbi:alpha/beta fold hydrolase [Pararhizobium sp. PWRC1-1]|uniref:alpha/beta fold hydrolase n=1 Tax=Pararhizobium sp. PWRC1-1 TaxID=2804566 RepID=UPI003CF13978
MQHTDDASFPVRSAQVNVDGQCFHIIEQGQGPAVLFCHGFPDTAQTWKSQMRAVPEAGYRAVALDMRGFGNSYSPAEAQLYTSLHVVGDFIGILDALDIPTAVIVGHDWGADCAQRAAVMRPDRFHALVSLSIPFAPRRDESLWDQLRDRGLGEKYYSMNFLASEAAKRFEPAAEIIPSILYWLSASPPEGTGWDPIDPARDMLRPSPVARPDWADPDYVEQTICSFEKTGFQTGLNYYRVVQTTFDLTAAFKNALVRQPSLYIWGAEDGLCNFFHPEPPTRESLLDTQPGLVDVIRIENAGHWLQHEAADRVNAELIRFLATIGPQPGDDTIARGA